MRLLANEIPRFRTASHWKDSIDFKLLLKIYNEELLAKPREEKWEKGGKRAYWAFGGKYECAGGWLSCAGW